MKWLTVVEIFFLLASCASLEKKDKDPPIKPTSIEKSAKSFAARRTLPYTKDEWTNINKKIDQQKPKLWTCLPNKVTHSRLIVTVTAQGRVKQVLVAEPKIQDNRLAQCILDDMITWSLPKTRNGRPMTLMIPMERDSH